MKKLALFLVLAILAGCESNSLSNQATAPEAAINKKPSKKCASCDMVLYPSSKPDTMLVVDVSDPENATVVSFVPTRWPYGGEVVRSGDYAYVLDGPRAWAIDLSDPYAPVVNPIGYGYYENELSGLQIAGGRLYARSGSDSGPFGLRSRINVFDLSDPANPVPISNVVFPPCPLPCEDQP